jgi:hypothetical protein
LLLRDIYGPEEPQVLDFSQPVTQRALNASNALIAQAAQRRLIESNAAMVYGGLATQIASGDAASTPAQASAYAHVNTQAIARIANTNSNAQEIASATNLNTNLNTRATQAPATT